MKKTAITLLCLFSGFFFTEIFYKSSAFEIKAYIFLGAVVISTILLIIDQARNEKIDN
jgi:hypothetical protein